MNSSADLPEDWVSQIEAYYAGELTPGEVSALRDQLNGGTPDLTTAVARHEALYRQGLQPDRPALVERARLRESLRKLEEEWAPAAISERPATAPRARRPRLPVWLLIAACLLLLPLGWWLLRQPDPAVQLARDNFRWLPRQEALLGPGDASPDGQSLYDLQEYDEAYPRLRDAVAAGEIDRVNLLYAGVAALGAGQPSEARQLLQGLLESGDYPLEEAALRYYLALAELQLGQTAAAEEQLRAVPDNDPELYRQAGRLLQAIQGLE